MTSSDDDGAENGATAMDEDRIADHLSRSGYLSWLSVAVESVDRGHVELSIPFADELTNVPWPDGTRTVHGGVVASALDVTGIMTVQSAADGATGATTTELNVSYLRPATGDLLVTGEAVRVGRTIGVARVTAESTTEEGERVEVAAGRVSIRVFRD